MQNPVWQIEYDNWRMTSNKEWLDFELSHASNLWFHSSSSLKFSNSSWLEIIIYMYQADIFTWTHKTIKANLAFPLSGPSNLYFHKRKIYLPQAVRPRFFSCPG